MSAVSLLLATMIAQAGPADPAAPRFVNVAEAAGLRTVLWCGGADKDHLLESTGSGAAFLDYDGDGRLDVFLVNAWRLDEEPSAVRARGPNALYRNVGDGRFEDVTETAGVGDDGWGAGVCTGDYDGDGRPDLYVTNFGPNRLYRNRGDGTFEEVGEAAGVADDGWGAGAAFFDADRDGDLDLYAANYVESTMDEVLAAARTLRWRGEARVMVGPFGMRGDRDRFYSNRGDGTFEDATEAAGLTDTAEGYGLGVLASDLDDDGDVDLYVANDSNPNYLYRNEGDGSFTEMGAWCGAGFSGDGAAQAGMGVDGGDYDGDGRLDIFVTNFARDHCTLYRNLGDLFFEDVSAHHDIKRATHPWLSWGCAFFDYDLDGDEDLLVVNGHIYPQVDDHPDFEESYRQPPLLFRNDGGRFVEVPRSPESGLDMRCSGRGIALGDYDGDGDIDLLITAMDSPPILLRNDTETTGHWLRVRVLDSNGAAAVGALVTITCGERSQRREIRSGSTYQSQSALEAHFGLGAADVVDRLEVRWLDGRRVEMTGVQADRIITVERPE